VLTCFLTVDSIHVHAQQPVNASVFAPYGCRQLIPLWFPQSNFRFLYSTHSGVPCQHPPHAKHGACSSDDLQGRRGRLKRRCGGSGAAIPARLSHQKTAAHRQTSDAARRPGGRASPEAGNSRKRLFLVIHKRTFVSWFIWIQPRLGNCSSVTAQYHFPLAEDFAIVLR
jgi:hypothetical protein